MLFPVSVFNSVDNAESLPQVKLPDCAEVVEALAQIHSDAALASEEYLQNTVVPCGGE